MKKILLSAALICLTTLAFAQRGTPAQLKLKNAPGLSSSFRTLAGPTLALDPDCTPPPCSGIIDPWTCECTPDIKDPWEDDKIAARMRGVQALERAMTKGDGKEFLPASLVTAAKRKYPGKSAKALQQRAAFYAKAAARN